MPKVSKIKQARGTVGSRPGQPLPREREPEEFWCSRCKKSYKKQQGNFPGSQSPLYSGNNKYLTVCNRCVEELFDHYKKTLGSEKEAMKRICLKFDIYWSPELYKMVGNGSEHHCTNPVRIRNYISRTNLIKFVGKTFDDTLDEEVPEIKREITTIRKPEDAATVYSYDEDADEEIRVAPEVVRYWGTGFTPEMYRDLEERRKYWLSQFPSDITLDPGEEALLRQICNLEISINRALAAGESIEKQTNALNTLLGSMNIKPSQKKNSEDAGIPFGCEIARFEEEDPIIEPDEQFADVDGMKKNIMTWFLGSLCKTAGIKNDYSNLFEEETRKYTVERPKYEEEEGEDD